MWNPQFFRSWRRANPSRNHKGKNVVRRLPFCLEALENRIVPSGMSLSLLPEIPGPLPPAQTDGLNLPPPSGLDPNAPLPPTITDLLTAGGPNFSVGDGEGGQP